MGVTREEICERTARKLAQAEPSLAGREALVGLDGFVDAIISVVDTRYSGDRYDPVPTIDRLAEKIRNAAGQSSNYELVVKRRKLGGNGPIMANALVSLGLPVTYIGALGHPAIDPAFDELAQRARVFSVAQPGTTDALEFTDGKLMFSKYESLGDVTWESLVARIGRSEITSLFESAQLVGLVNWTMVPQMSRIWSRLLDEVYAGGQRRAGVFFVDLADPEKRTADDIREALALLTKFQQRLDVVFGLNLKEACEIAEVLQLKLRAEPEAEVTRLAVDIRDALAVSCVVIHPRRSAAAAVDGDAAWFAGPFIEKPLISTGAGDHFNAGFCLGRMLGFDLTECLCAGVATSGYYVRSGHSPTVRQLAEFVAALPEPQAT